VKIFPKRKLNAFDFTFDMTGNVILIIALVVSFSPIIWMMLNSFRTTNEMFSKPMAMPVKYDFSVFVTAWKRASYNTALVNSLLNTIGTNIIVLVVSASAAFALARIDFPGAKLIVGVLSSSIVISGQLVLIPLFFVLRMIGIYNTLWATIIADAAMDMPICIILFTGFFRNIPYEIEESTVIEGCTKWDFFIRFVIPLSKPIVATSLIFVSLWTWNEYLFALTFLKDNSVRTIPLQLQNFFGRFATEYSLLFAALSISIIPLIILYVFMQKSFIKGLTAGAIK
jgi:raffinose/stachyose/melibiose transport system permease protein